MCELKKAVGTTLQLDNIIYSKAKSARGGKESGSLDDAAQIKSSLRRITSDLKKFHSYLAYLMELGYDLAIRPSYNVSENPGFESIAGLFES